MSGGQQRLSVLARHVLTANLVAAKADPDEIAAYEPGEHYGCLPDYEHPIRCAKKGMFSAEACPPRNFPSLLAEAAKHFPQELALAAEKPVPAPLGPGNAPSLPWAQWKKWTWAQYYQDARSAAKAFMKLGVQQFGSVSIFGFNAPEWMISAFGAMLCGGKYVGIYSTDTPDQLAYKVSHSGSQVVVVDSQVEYDCAAAKINELPILKAIIVWGMPAPGDLKRSDGSVVRVMSWDALLEFGHKEGSDADLDARMAAQRPGHCVGIIYTSGTTGNPKAVMIHSDAVIAQGAMMSRPELGISRAWEDGEARILSYLPLSHIAGGLMDILNPVYSAGHNKWKTAVYFARPYDLKEMTLGLRIQFVRPTAFLAVPRVFEKMQGKMMAVGASITGIKKNHRHVGEGKRSRLRAELATGRVAGKTDVLWTRGQAHPLQGSGRPGLGQVQGLHHRCRPHRYRDLGVLRAAGYDDPERLRYERVWRPHDRYIAGQKHLRHCWTCAAGHRGQVLPGGPKWREHRGATLQAGSEELVGEGAGRALLPRPSHHDGLHGEPGLRPRARQGNHRQERICHRPVGLAPQWRQGLHRHQRHDSNYRPLQGAHHRCRRREHRASARRGKYQVTGPRHFERHNGRRQPQVQHRLGDAPGRGLHRRVPGWRRLAANWRGGEPEGEDNLPGNEGSDLAQVRSGCHQQDEQQPQRVPE
mmetsp:Transcript_159993/g.509467  ORF Transcript_159993/g.509467 Transcript_159993/m.509467 type:complete len:698 (-) Transcript_159993:260-2353(-)